MATNKQRSGQSTPPARKARKRAGVLWLAAACVLALLPAGSRAYSAQPSVGEILRKVGDVYSHLQDYHIVATRESVSRGLRSIFYQHSVITLDVAGRGQVRMAMTGNGPNILIVSNGSTTWYYLPRKKEYLEREAAASIESPGAQGNSAKRSDFLGQMQDLLVGRFVKIAQFEESAELEGKSKLKFEGRKVSCYKVLLHFKDMSDQLWIDPTSFQVLKLKTTIREVGGPGASAGMDTVQLKVVTINPTRSPVFLTFTPPAGVRRVAVLDLPGLGQGYIGSSPENFTLPDVEGRPVNLSDFRGKTVLLSFWAIWCPPCNKELPEIEKIYEQHKDKKDVVILAVDDESKWTISNFLEKKHYNFTALVDRKRTLFKRFDVRFIPTAFVINGRGIIVQKIVGWEGPKALLAALEVGEQ